MMCIPVKLDDFEQVGHFVNITNRYPFVIELRQDRFVVDAKSLLGIFSLDRSKPLTVDIYTDHCDALVSDLEGLSA